jgi:hypothetical protein
MNKNSWTGGYRHRERASQSVAWQPPLLLTLTSFAMTASEGSLDFEELLVKKELVR